MASTVEAENRKQTPEQRATYIDKSMGGSTLKEILAEDPWYMSTKPSGNEAVAVSQW